MIERRPNGKFRARVSWKGQTVASRTFNLKRDATAWHDEQKRRILLGDWVDPRAADILMRDLFAQYLQAIAPTSNPKSYDTSEQHIRTHLLPRLGSRPASTMTVNLFENLFQDLLRGGLSLSTVKRIRDTLSSIYTWAVRNELLRTHLVQKTRITAQKNTQPKRDVRPLSDKTLMSVLKTQGAIHAGYVLVTEFAALTGLRWGELAALRVADVRTGSPMKLYLHRSRSDSYEEKSTKSGRGRYLPLVQRAAEIVEASMVGKSDVDHVFTTSRGKPMNLANFKRGVQWDRTSEGHRVHDLRHTAATTWLLAGIDVTTVSKWLGHSSPVVTLNVYSHYLGDASDLAALKKLEPGVRQTENLDPGE